MDSFWVLTGSGGVMGSLALTVKLGCFPVALLFLLLEQLEACTGAGQEKPEALGAESPQSEVSLDPGAPGRKALPRVWGAGACT